MKLSNYMYGLIIVGACVLTVYGVLSNMTSEHHYDLEVDTKYQTLYDNIDTISSDFNKTTHSMQQVTEDKEAQFWTGIIDTLRLAKDVVFGGVGAIIGSINIGYQLITITVVEAGLPGYTIKVLFAFLAIIIFGIVFYLYTGREM